MERMRALSVRQPYAEQILRGTKKIEYRSTRTNIRGRVYIYAGKSPGSPEAWQDIDMQPGELPTGVLVGTVEVTGCSFNGEEYEWHLSNPERLRKTRKPKNHPQPMWFFPF